MKNLFIKIIALSIAVIMLSVSCKKSSNSTTPTPIVTPVAPYGGQLQVNNQFTDNTLTGGGKDSTGSAATLLSGAVNVGTVTVNTFSLTFQYNSYFIATNIVAPIEGKAKWTVSGGSGYGAFTYTTSKNIPFVEDLHLALSSFSRSANLVLIHATILADSIAYTITDDHSNTVRKVIANSSSGITFTPSMMGSLVVSTDASIQVLGYSSENSVQGGKSITFQNASSYQKGGIAIN